ncbi:MAG: SDR family oxidoreductase [Candidatus Doudnabacteria bacterium]|nr:SDR family oxidoreductase [Candidatus Doudnabacteria bacterium]
MELNGKVVILTGAARIGADVGKKLVEKGVKLAVTYFNNQPDLGDVLYVKADLTKPEDVARVVAETKKRYGQIDALVHMAANYKRTPWEKISDETMQESMWAILRSAVLMSKAVGDELLKNSQGKIILFSDWSVLNQPYKDYLPYNVAKSAVVGLTKSLAKELAPKIAVNAIAPGPILMPPDLSDEENAEVLKNTPLERWGGEEEITKAVLYLLDSDFVTGQVLYVDGGRSIA